jgi:uncharacterized protein involved in oxidation of intracellular sulfur
MSVLFILNDPPYGTERVYNGLRLANALPRAGAEDITVFLMADAVLAAKANQKTPEGYYNLERMLRRFTTAGGKVLLCGTCMDARGLTEAEVVDGAKPVRWMNSLRRRWLPTRSWCSDEQPEN